MFPIYWKVLKVALGLAFLVEAAASIATAAAGKTFSQSIGVLFHYPSVALMVFAWVTLVFSALEFFGARFHVSDCWDPRKLPPLVKTDPRKSQFELITQLLVQTAFSVWWLAGLHYQYLIFGPGVAFLSFGPVWHTIYPLFVVLAIVDLGLTAAKLFWPRWTQSAPIRRVVMSALGLVVLYFLLNAPDLFVAADPSTPRLLSLARNINYGVRLGLKVVALINVINIVLESARFIGRRLGRMHQAAVGS
jgi:hypothetical protein